MQNRKGKELPSIYLASTSKRRHQILDSIGFKFTIREPSGDEQIHRPGDLVDDTVRINARRKATSVEASVSESDAILVGADTLVVVQEEVLGKPRNEREAREMLLKLSGRSHFVVTGVCLLSHKYGESVSATKTEVEFRKLSEAEVSEYVASPEPYDKAGGYAIQGLASLFVRSITGSYTNVVGFPIETFLIELRKLTGFPPFQWVH